MKNFNTSYQVQSYKKPVSVRGHLMPTNNFLKVQFQGHDFFFSTITGLHEISLKELEHHLHDFFQSLSIEQLNFHSLNFNQKYFGLIINEDSLHHEVLFAIEVLLLSLIKNIDINKDLLINQVYSSQVNVKEYKNTQCLKLKISPKLMKENLSVLTSLHRENPHLIFRLDGNRQFELIDLLEFKHQLDQLPESSTLIKKIDYFEEPLKNFYESYLFLKNCPIPIALDESFKSYFRLDQKIPFENSIAVIKPALYGISSVYKWMNQNADSRVIISSSYEHPSVLYSLSFLGQLRPTEFHGLENQF